MTAPGFLEESLLISNETKEMQEMFLLGKEYGYIYGLIMNDHKDGFNGPIRTKNIPRLKDLLQDHKYEITKCGYHNPDEWMWLTIFKSID